MPASGGPGAYAVKRFARGQNLEIDGIHFRRFECNQGVPAQRTLCGAEADVLYGVTMQEQGVSHLLTINLNDVEKELHIK